MPPCLTDLQPHYARALTQALLTPYKLNHFPYQDLLIYEVGAGNGSFMLDSLCFLRDHHPEVFERTRYRIIEISPALAEIQRRRAEEAGLGERVEVINQDVFKWEGGGADPCFVVALEVFVHRDF
jgi:SAM-dependent MidA family methyltransferase